MPSLELKGVRKSFGATPVLDDVSLTLDSREFIAFLGPSGSGKSTLLRIIAGLETADSGEVWIEGRRIDQLPPGDRGVAMVFQHYALYPHMTARQNMAFGLKNACIPADEMSRISLHHVFFGKARHVRRAARDVPWHCNRGKSFGTLRRRRASAEVRQRVRQHRSDGVR